MPDPGPTARWGARLFNGWRRFLWAAAFGVPGVAVAVPDQVAIDLDRAIAAQVQRLETEGPLALTAATVLALPQVSALVAPVAGADRATPDWNLDPGPMMAGRTNMRLALTMLAQAYGDDGHFAVIAAQEDPDLSALALSSGHADLDDLAAAMEAAGLPFDSDGQVLTLHRPLILWPGSSLTLRAGDHLVLDRAAGAFLMNFGHLDVQGAAISTTADLNPRARAFAPFVTTADGGTLHLDGATLTGLGFGDTMKFSGVAVMRSILRAPAAPSLIENSLLSDIVSLSVSGDGGVTIRGNAFRDLRGPALVIARTFGATLQGNLFSGDMVTNAIRLEHGSAEGRVLGNVILGGDRAGIVVRGDSPGALVAGNLVWRRDGGGIGIISPDCGQVTGNLVLDNDQKGIEVRDSTGALVTGNTVLSNDSAGIWVSDQRPETETRIEGNTIAFNGSGIASANGGRVALSGNDFSGQFLQFLSGDLAQQAREIALDPTGRHDMILTAAGVVPPLAALDLCEGRS